MESIQDIDSQNAPGQLALCRLHGQAPRTWDKVPHGPRWG